METTKQASCEARIDEQLENLEESTVIHLTGTLLTGSTALMYLHFSSLRHSLTLTTFLGRDATGRDVVNVIL